MCEKEIGVIINPTAGKGKAKQVWNQILPFLKTKKINLRYRLTSSPKEAGKLASELIQEGCSKIAIIGGDGTLHEAINGQNIINDRVAFGIIPAGTGNDLVRTLNIPNDPLQACQVILDGYYQKIDLGLINGETYFVNTAGVGFDVEIAKLMNSNKRLFFNGKGSYFISILRTLITYSNLNLILETDDKSTEISNCFLLSIGNAKYIGGGIKLIPSAKPNDGYFHLLIAKDIKRTTVVRKFASIYKGNHVDNYQVMEIKTKTIKIEPGTKNTGLSINYHSDGEIYGSIPAHIQLIPQKLPIITPKNN
ncbi:diacylglycerol/lipid kinase family protein [Natranaerobius thermophilus]|nr:diacylglycerol kinase family protein [Natranaerobius thermophilus]